MSDWEFVKARTTTATGAVWRSADGSLFKRTGGEELCEEVAFQRQAAELGYPVPEVVSSGSEDDNFYVIERSLGPATLHDEALADAQEHGEVTTRVLNKAAVVSIRLLEAEANNPKTGSDWFDKAAFAGDVFAENPDLDTSRVRELIARAIGRTEQLPHTLGHLDYGLPNMLQDGVIDWQHHGLVPLGYDVYTALDVIAFKGGGKGYSVTAGQRAAYLDSLDRASVSAVGLRLSDYLGDFLLVKCFFFLALMRPTDPARLGKHAKWQYRRALFTMGVEQYESAGTIDTGTFPTLTQYSSAHR